MTLELFQAGSQQRVEADGRVRAETFRVETLASLGGEGEAFLSSSPGGVIVVVGNLLHLLDVECEELRETVDFDEVSNSQNFARSGLTCVWSLSD